MNIPVKYEATAITTAPNPFDETLKCSACGRSFWVDKESATTLKSIDSSGKSWLCEDCAKSADSAKALADAKAPITAETQATINAALGK